MTTQIIMFINLLLYSIIVAQAVSYIISLTDVQQKMNADEYIVFRKLTDRNFRSKFTKVVYGTLLSNLVLVIITIINFNSLLLITSAVALTALVIDVLLAVKGNLPINAVINTWAPGNYPENWVEYRRKWLAFFRLRQIANICGFISLVSGSVFS